MLDCVTVTGLAYCWGSSVTQDELQPPVSTVYLNSAGEVVTLNEEGGGDEETDGIEGFVSDEKEEAKNIEIRSRGLSLRLVNIPFVQISVGAGLSCGIRYVDRALHCWGNLHRLRLPGGSSSKKAVIVPGSYVQVSAGRLGVCAIVDDQMADGTAIEEDPEAQQQSSLAGLLQCWGLAATRVPSFQRQKELLGETDATPGWVQVSVGYASVCAVSSGSQLFCWGGDHNEMQPQDLEIA